MSRRRLDMGEVGIRFEVATKNRVVDSKFGFWEDIYVKASP